jgi:ATPase subunit of ABC transporter with duplicated ATPase domains
MGRPLLSAHEIVRTIGTRTILRAVSLAVDDRSATALIGLNGSGKSTLMRILAGELEPDGGRVVRRRGAAVLYLPQLDSTDDARPVRAVLHERLGVAGAATRMDALAARLAAGADVVDAHARALEEWLARGGPDVDARLDQAAAAGGLAAAQLDRAAAELSGGQRARAMLAAIEAARSEVLLLNEPANHLDIEALQALEGALADWPGALVVATHDARLRDRLELDVVVDLGADAVFNPH